MTAVSNTLGTVNPIRELAALCKKNGAYILVDAAQSVAHQPYDLSGADRDIDFLAFSGHKMMASTGVGVLYGKKELLKKMPPFFMGGGIVHDVTMDSAVFSSIPSRFEAGTPPIAEAISLMHAVNYIQNLGWDLIQGIDGYQRNLGNEVFGRYKDYIRVFGNTADKAPIFSFQVNETHPHDIGSFLNEFKLCLRTGHQCTQPLWKAFGVSSVTRASAFIYNTEEEWDTLSKALKSLLEFFHVGKFS